jgi:hypothetical protein
LYLALQLVDSLWHFAGDKSTDMNWYSKRLSLLAIYKSTELAMMQVWVICLLTPGVNPTIASYNASVVKIYSAVNSMARF